MLPVQSAFSANEESSALQRADHSLG